ncbi:MAG: nucleotide exchange factor GrpE [bacterium]
MAEISQESGVRSQESGDRKEKIVHKKKIELLMEIEEKDAKIEEYLNLAKVIKADFENYKKRQEEERVQLKKIYQREILIEFLNVFDNLERALREGTGNREQGIGNIEKIIDGIGLVKKGFEEILSKFGVKRIETIGHSFSPKFHTAILSIPTKEQREGIILEEVQSGWKDNDFCLRPASVIVSKGWEEEASQKAE